MTTLATCLWLWPEDGPRAVELYTSVLPRCTTEDDHHLTKDDEPGGEVRLWTLDVDGHELRVMAPDGAERPTTAVSMWLVVEDQEALDRVWDGFLEAGGEEMACAWIRDPFGVCWQVLPKAWEWLTSGDPAQAQRVVEALWQMKRVDVAALERAAAGEGA